MLVYSHTSGRQQDQFIQNGHKVWAPTPSSFWFQLKETVPSLVVTHTRDQEQHCPLSLTFHTIFLFMLCQNNSRNWKVKKRRSEERQVEQSNGGWNSCVVLCHGVDGQQEYKGVDEYTASTLQWQATEKHIKGVSRHLLWVKYSKEQRCFELGLVTITGRQAHVETVQRDSLLSAEKLQWKNFQPFQLNLFNLLN